MARMVEQGIQTILAKAVALLLSDAILGPRFSIRWLRVLEMASNVLGWHAAELE
jgi:hypothetical protein